MKTQITNISRNIHNSLFATCATGLTWILGEWDTPLQVLMVFVILDYITGVLSGVVNKRLSSCTGFNGIAKKSVIFVMLIVAVMVDRILENDTWVVRNLTCFFYIANEGISILENATSLGVPVPDKVRDILIQLKDGNKKGSN